MTRQSRQRKQDTHDCHPCSRKSNTQKGLRRNESKFLHSPLQSSTQDSRDFSHERNVQNKFVFNMGLKPCVED